MWQHTPATGDLLPAHVRHRRLFGYDFDGLEKLLQTLLHGLGRYRLSGLGIEGMVVIPQATHRLVDLFLTFLALADLLLPVVFGLLGPVEVLFKVGSAAGGADARLVLLVALLPILDL